MFHVDFGVGQFLDRSFSSLMIGEDSNHGVDVCHLGIPFGQTCLLSGCQSTSISDATPPLTEQSEICAGYCFLKKSAISEILRDRSEYCSIQRLRCGALRNKDDAIVHLRQAYVRIIFGVAFGVVDGADRSEWRSDERTGLSSAPLRASLAPFHSV